MIVDVSRSADQPGRSHGPLVSIILIFLNEERFLQEALESVSAQSYDNWELLLVDDGSSDGSSAIAQRFAAEHPGKVRYLEHDGHQNRGMSASRNLGIQHATGGYLTFLDGDDVWLPHKLEQQVAIMDSHPAAALVCGRAQWWYSWTGDATDIQRDFIQQLDVPLDTLIGPPALLTLFLQNEWASLCDVMVRREIADAVGGYEETFSGMYEDQVFHAKICLNRPVFVASQCWYRYRQHDEACTAQSHKRGGYEATRRMFLRWLKGYVSRQSGLHAKVRLVLRKELLRLDHPRVFQLVGATTQLLPKAARRFFPARLQHWLYIQRRDRAYSPPVGWVRFGDLRRLTPISREWGFDRGQPIDRFYIENFLARHARDVHGRVLEIAEDTYTRRFGGERVTRSDVLHVVEGNPQATIVADLADAEQIPSNSFDCCIVTQTILCIYDVHAAIRTVHRILKPGGVALVTVPGISPISRDDMAQWGQFWSFTSLSAKRLFEEVFPAGGVSVEAHGNVVSTIAFLHGLARQELRQAELDWHDPRYELLITIRAEKSGATP
jgi:glycosyltransferase involved in cell wall biosynthesis